MILFFILFFGWLLMFLCMLIAAWGWGSEAAIEYVAYSEPEIFAAQIGNRSPPK